MTFYKVFCVVSLSLVITSWMCLFSTWCTSFTPSPMSLVDIYRSDWNMDARTIVEFGTFIILYGAGDSFITSIPFVPHLSLIINFVIGVIIDCFMIEMIFTFNTF